MIANITSGKSFKSLLNYLCRDDKMDWKEARNLPSDHRNIAGEHMKFTAMQSEKVEDPVYHVSLSWSANDNPTKEQMIEAADEWLKGMELDEHQAVIVGHGDRNHSHLHIAINRVHQKTEIAWDRYKDREKSEEILRDLEREFDWQLIPGRNYGEWDKEFDGRAPKLWEIKQQKKSKKVAMGVGVDPESIDGRSILERCDEIKDDLFEAPSFRKFDKALDKQGLWLQAKGQGMVITDGHYHIKASDISRQLSGPKLEDKFGQPLEDYVSEREKEVSQEAGLKLVSDWKRRLETEELHSLKRILDSKEPKAQKWASDVKQMDRAYEKKMRPVQKRINENLQAGFVNPREAQAEIADFLKERPDEDRFGEAAKALIENPSDFGKVKDENAVVALSEAFRKAQGIGDHHAEHFRGVSKDERKELVKQAKKNAKETSNSLSRIRGQLSRKAQQTLRESEGGRAVSGTYYESLSIYRATQAIHSQLAGPELSIKRNRQMDREMFQALFDINREFHRAFEDPSKAEETFNTIAWDSSSEVHISELVNNPRSFGEVRDMKAVGNLPDLLREPANIRGENEDFFSEKVPSGRKAQYFQQLPRAMEDRLGELAGMSLEAGKQGSLQISRWLGKAAFKTESGRAIFQMGSKALKYSLAIAKMLKSPGAGGLKLVKGVIKDSIIYQPEQDRNRGISR